MVPPLLSRGTFLAFLFLLQASDDVVVAQTEMDGNQIVGVAATGNTIHAEQFLDFSSLPYPATINVVSDVPVTVERYYDSGYYLDGQQPLLTYMGKVLVTSNCDTSETTVIPNVVYDNGTITVTLDGVSEDEAKGMEFLEPSYYEAFWTWASGLCQYFISTSGTPPVTTTTSEGIVTSSTTGAAVSGSGVECQIGEAANPALDCTTEGEFCQLDTGVCNNKSGIHYGICVTIPQMCTEEYNPVCGCDEVDYSNSCAAHSNGISVSRFDLCTTSTTTSTATESIASGSTTTAFIATASGTECQIGESADPSMGCMIEGEFCQLKMGVCNDGSGIQYGVCATIPEACTLDYSPVCGCDGLDYSNACAAFGQGVSVSRMGQCTTTSSVATESSGGGTSTVMIATGTACQIGEAADPATACTAVGEFCQLEIGVCNNKSGIHDGACATVPQVCTEEYNPVCGCDEMDYSNSCAAHSNGVSVSRMGICTTSSTMNVATVAATPEATTTVFEDIIVTTTAATSPTTSGSTASSSSGTSTTVTSTTASVATDTSAATTVASSTGTTTTSTNGTTTVFVGIGEFPTEAPSSNSTTVGGVSNDPNNLEQQDDSRGTSPNSAINRSRPVSICIASAFLAIFVISVILPGNGTGSQHLWGIGIAVAAVAASSLYSRPSRSVRAMQQSNHGSKSFPYKSIVRNLQTCSFNVEVLLDSCTKTVAVAAPAGRYISVVLANQTSQPVDNCTYSYEANLTFPVANAVTLDLNADNTIEAFDSFDFRCARAVDGRPFVDASGGGLLAEPCAIGGGDDSNAAFSWIGETSAGMQNVTTHAHSLLGEYWTQRALGEHASVASFSAFTIALMTNQAPSDLVEAALKAGLDEVRHAKTSFEIASILAGKTISPGPLPSSIHEFHHDLTSLAMAVAREGCVDETISAFVAAAEALHITKVLETGFRDSKYSNVDRDTLTNIRDELINIAMDESNHSALAWQTLQWVCSVDSSSCDAVYNDVFNESTLESKFVQRAHNALGEVASPGAIRSEWKKIFNAARSGAPQESIYEGDCVGGVDGQCFSNHVFTSMTDNVLRQVSHSSAEAFVAI